MSEESEFTKGQKSSFTKQLRDFKEETQQSLSEIKDEIISIKKFSKVYLDETNEKSVKNRIDNLLDTIEEQSKQAEKRFNEISDLHIKLCDGDDENDSYDVTISSLKEEIEDHLKTIESKKKNVDVFLESVVGKVENGKITQPGLTQQFESKLKLMDDFYKNQDKRFKTLFESIEGLLPGATSVGLAKAYEEQKMSYAQPLKDWSRVFVCTMIIMLGFGCYYFVEISKIGNLSIANSVISLLNKLPFFIPAIWLALYASKKQSQYKRLQQEYAFKETFAKSYEGHKNQIEDLNYDVEDENELMKELISHLVNITSHNPSDTLDNKAHNDNHPIMKMFDKIIVSKGKGEE